MGHEELVTDAVRARAAAESAAWLRAGRSTGRCDRPAAEAAVAAVYRAHGLAVPRTVVWMDSPLGGALASWVLRHRQEHRLDGTLLTDTEAGPPLRVSEEFARRAEERIREQLPAGGAGRRAADGAVRRRLAGTFLDTAGAKRLLVQALGEPLYEPLDFDWAEAEPGAFELEQAMGELLHPLTNHELVAFCLLVYRHLQGRVAGLVPDHVARPARVMDVVTPPPPPSREAIWFQDRFGGFLEPWADPARLIHWRCLLGAAGLPTVPALEAVQAALYRVGWWWPLDDAVVLTERPVTLHHTPAPPGDIHPSGVLIGYADGYRVEQQDAPRDGAGG